MLLVNSWADQLLSFFTRLLRASTLLPFVISEAVFYFIVFTNFFLS